MKWDNLNKIPSKYFNLHMVALCTLNIGIDSTDDLHHHQSPSTIKKF